MHSIEARVEQTHVVVQRHTLDLIHGLGSSVIADFGAESEGSLEERGLGWEERIEEREEGRKGEGQGAGTKTSN